MSKYDQLTDLEKAATNWQAYRLNAKQSAEKGGAGIYARQQRDEHIATLRESLTDSPGLPQLVQAYQRSLQQKTLG